MKTKTNKEVIEEFRERFELHDLGKDEFTLCCNNLDGTCDGGISIAKESEGEAKRHLEKVENFILQALNQKEREAEERGRKEIIETIKCKGCKGKGMGNQITMTAIGFFKLSTCSVCGGNGLNVQPYMHPNNLKSKQSEGK